MEEIEALLQADERYQLRVTALPNGAETIFVAGISGPDGVLFEDLVAQRPTFREALSTLDHYARLWNEEAGGSR